jgi:maltose-binding protein MalE
MKKVILTLMVAMFATGAFAQTTTPKTDKQKDMKDLRKDTRDVRHDKRLRAKDLKSGNNEAAKAETKEIKADRKDMTHHVKDLKKDGVKHPVNRAHHQMHKQKIRHHS